MKTKTKRIKSPVARALDINDVELLVAEIQLLKTNEIRATANLDAAIADIRAPYDLQIAAYQDAAKAKTAQLQQWAESHPEHFTKKKSLDFPLGTIGFRTGTPKLKLLRQWKWADVLEALRAVIWGPAYLRVCTEINKEAIIRDHLFIVQNPPAAAVLSPSPGGEGRGEGEPSRRGEGEPTKGERNGQHAPTAADLKRIGVTVAQDESFFVDPKLTEVETRESAPSQQSDAA